MGRIKRKINNTNKQKNACRRCLLGQLLPFNIINEIFFQTDAKQQQIHQKQQQQQEQQQQQQNQNNQQRSGSRQVRRTRSDLGGQRLLGWEQRQAARRMLRNMALSRKPLSPRKRPPDENDEEGLVVLRRHVPGTPPRRPALRRSLSQPVDIDKISPLVVLKTSSKYFLF